MKLSARVYQARIAESDTEVMFTTATLGVQLFDLDGKLLKTVPWTAVRGWTKSIVRMKSGKIEIWLTLDVFAKKGTKNISTEMEFAMAEADVDEACELMRETTSQIKNRRDEIQTTKKAALITEARSVQEQIAVLSPRGRKSKSAKVVMHEVMLDGYTYQMQVATEGLQLFRNGQNFRTYLYADLRGFKHAAGGLELSVKGAGKCMEVTLRSSTAAYIVEEMHKAQASMKDAGPDKDTAVERHSSKKPGDTMFVLTNLLNLRHQPNKNKVPITILSQGEVLMPTGKTSKGGWLQVIAPGKQTGWVTEGSRSERFVGTYQQLCAQMAKDGKAKASTAQPSLELSQGLFSAKDAMANQLSAKGGQGAVSDFMSPRTATSAAMNHMQDCFYATLEKNKKVMITVGSVGVQFFSVNKKGKVSLTPSKTITFTSLLKWSKRISRQEQKVWVVLRITSVAPSVFFKTTNAPAEELRVELASSKDADKFLQRMGETAMLIKEARDTDAVNEVTSMMGETYSPRTATGMARKMTIEAKDSIGSPRWRAMGETERLRAVKLTAAAHSSMRAQAPPEEAAQEPASSGGHTPRGPPPEFVEDEDDNDEGLKLELAPPAPKVISAVPNRMRMMRGGGGGGASPLARAAMGRQMQERAAKLVADDAAAADTAKTRDMNEELSYIREQINDLTPRSRARVVAKQAKAKMYGEVVDGYGAGLDEDVDDLNSPTPAGGMTSI